MWMATMGVQLTMQSTLTALEFNMFKKKLKNSKKKFIGDKNIITNIYKIQAYDSIMRG